MTLFKIIIWGQKQSSIDNNCSLLNDWLKFWYLNFWNDLSVLNLCVGLMHGFRGDVEGGKMDGDPISFGD